MHKNSKFGENLLLREGSVQRALDKFAPILEVGIRQILKVDILRNNFIPFRFCIFFMMGGLTHRPNICSTITYTVTFFTT